MTGLAARAQLSNSLLPVVTIQATDASASEPGVLTVIDFGIFTVSRSGSTNFAMTVYYTIGGTASNGVDFSAISNSVVIPAGAASARVIINPLDDVLPEGTETVTLRLQNPVCAAIYPPPPDCYRTGLPDSATVSILDNDPPTNNHPPVVTIVAIDPIASEGTNCCRWPGWSNSTPAGMCVTNTATFIVRRSGNTNAPLSVPYAIGGTASNSLDYATLSGSITIPAGRRSAEIRIVPIDDALLERIETTVLRLIGPSVASNNLPSYVVGLPGRAAAIIVDNDQPRPVTGVLPDRCFHIVRPGNNGSWWRIERSTDLINWTVLCTNTVTEGALHFVDPDAGESANYFYRALPEMNPPSE